MGRNGICGYIFGCPDEVADDLDCTHRQLLVGSKVVYIEINLDPLGCGTKSREIVLGSGEVIVPDRIECFRHLHPLIARYGVNIERTTARTALAGIEFEFLGRESNPFFRNNGKHDISVLFLGSPDSHTRIEFGKSRTAERLIAAPLRTVEIKIAAQVETFGRYGGRLGNLGCRGIFRCLVKCPAYRSIDCIDLLCPGKVRYTNSRQRNQPGQ